MQEFLNICQKQSCCMLARPFEPLKNWEGGKQWLRWGFSFGHQIVNYYLFFWLYSTVMSTIQLRFETLSASSITFQSKMKGKFGSYHFYAMSFGNKLSLTPTLQALVWKQLEIWLPVGPGWFWLAATFPKAIQLFKTFNKRLATKSWLWKNSTSHQWRVLDNLPGTSFKTRKGMVIGENASSNIREHTNHVRTGIEKSLIFGTW